MKTLVYLLSKVFSHK